jgi:hypothetical protein
MKDMKNMNDILKKTLEVDAKDDGLKENERIEEAIAALQKEPSQELLAHVLTLIRRRMRDGGQFIISVEPPKPGDKAAMQLKAVKSDDDRVWWMAFTSFDEEVKGSDAVMSTFMTDIRQLFEAALQVDEIAGIILNPWNRTIMLDKQLLRLILSSIGCADTRA